MDLQGIPFTKVYKSMLTSSIWTTPHPRLHMIRCVWMTLMLMADRHGFVHSSVPGLAAQAVVTLEEAQEALEMFRSPDPYSRSKENEGRKLLDVDGGWFLLNYATHREVTREELNKASKRRWYHRQKLTKTRTDVLTRYPTRDLESQPSLFSDQDPDRSLAEQEQKGAETPTREPSEAQSQPAVFRNLDAWVTPDEVYDTALLAGLSRAAVDERIAELRNGPIGGVRGVFDRTKYVLRQVPKWRVWAETASHGAVHKPGSTGGASGGLGRGPRFGPVLEPTGRHRAFAEKHGIDLAAMVRELTEQGAVESLGVGRALELLGQRLSKAKAERKGAA